MPFKVWSIGEEVLAADFNSYVQSQVVSRFTNAAGRTAAIPSPVLNQLTALDARAGIVQYWNGGAWQDQSPYLLAYTESVQAQGGIASTPVDINGLTVSPLTIPAGRRLRLEAHSTFVKQGAETSGNLFLRVQDSGLVMQQTVLASMSPNANVGLYVSKIVSPPGGTYTFKCMCWCDASTASRQTAVNAWIQVTDLGAV